jgi:hypothetical protein
MRRFIVLFVLLLAACGTPATVSQPTVVQSTASASSDGDPCGTTALGAYRNTYNSIIDRWGDAVLAAGQASKAQLQPAIASLEKIAGEMEGLAAPPCAAPAHAESLEAMRLAINGYQTLMAQQDAGTKIRDSIDLLADARIKVAALPGTPEPTPTVPPTSTPLPTFTPVPTITPTATPEPTPTLMPRIGILTSKTVQVFETSTSTQPIKTLTRNTEVEVYEAAKGRIHIRIGSLDGWVSQSSLVMK